MPTAVLPTHSLERPAWLPPDVRPFERIQGLVLDGPTPYNLALLRPEILLCVLSVVAIVLERGRRHGDRNGADRRASLQPSTAIGGGQ